MNIGEKIFQLRKDKKLSQEQLALKLNVTRQTISKWELNESNLDINQAITLSRVFEIDLNELIGNYVGDSTSNKEDKTTRILDLIFKIQIIIIIIMLCYSLLIYIQYL